MTGASAIIIILGICVVVTTLSLGMGLLSYFENSTAYSYLNAQEAYLVAQSGIYDGLYRISINKDYENLTGYSIGVGQGSATIVVDKDNPQYGFSLITSTAIVKNTRKVHEVKVMIDSITGKLTIVSWQEKAV
ncbi:MAG: hypothetical protein UX65_C0003G0036 [Parcubacteria group bacterium GW2011_GWB1_46_8]|nr:MAG: hypothetical protein UX15_C0021G0006 [Parcubacteria group bacterium GW2011_GWA1_45_7]KKU43432.1 MAG: hypothetical protein UX61_C0020G0004 [Parcubacteria group bacterium GW2011_GWA2_46_7]KKU46493.1 MAG: hypothetical protein UX65_C0003G0036 [Parcubacteria group bacterium GW2011_GWB1_46_8]KKU47050.1 MAG: hypothetical protein UX66_C0027G0016 [Parcubacteria group bacterium GW2011_GWF2_46_8]